MEFKFSTRSENNLQTCDIRLIKLMELSLESSPLDFSIICGHRNEHDQNIAYSQGKSKLQYPHSKHNIITSMAVDIQPYPYTKDDILDKNNLKFKLLSNHVKKIARDLNINVINGGLDWGWDWYHWELVL